MKNLIRKILKEEILLKSRPVLETKNSRKGLLMESTTVGQPNFQEIYSTMWDKMLNTVCSKYTKDRNKAKDFCQNGFVKVYQNLHKFEDTGSLEGWVRRVITNSTLDDLRKDKKKIHSSSEEPNWSVIDTHEEEYNETYSVEQIESVLPQLSPAYRRIFELYYFSNLTHVKIAKKLGISQGTSKSNLFKAKKKIRELIGNI